jgi:hypothetical protein
MHRLKTLFLVLTVHCIAAVCASLPAQETRQVPQTAQSVTVIPQTAPAPREIRLQPRSVPFSLDAKNAVQRPSIALLSVDQMSQSDRALADGAQPAIRERAAKLNPDLNTGAWTYRQVLCPELPNHVFLRFARNSGPGDLSLFTASIPRDVDGKVRIVPIRMRGYQLFTPAPESARGIAVFNRIREEEHAGTSANWLATGLCYAALTGGTVQAAVSAEGETNRQDALASPPSLQLTHDGGAIVTFTDAEAKPRPVAWSLCFDPSGKLLKVTHRPATIPEVKAITPSTVPRSELVPATHLESGKPVPAPDLPTQPIS